MNRGNASLSSPKEIRAIKCFQTWKDIQLQFRIMAHEYWFAFNNTFCLYVSSSCVCCENFNSRIRNYFCQITMGKSHKWTVPYVGSFCLLFVLHVREKFILVDLDIHFIYILHHPTEKTHSFVLLLSSLFWYSYSYYSTKILLRLLIFRNLILLQPFWQRGHKFI